MKKVIIAIIIILIIVFGGLFFYLHRNSNDQHITLYGNVDIRTVNLSYRVGGRLSSLSVDEGDQIHKGQLLGELDKKPYELILEQAQANVDTAKANLDLLLAGTRKEVIAQAQNEVAQLQAAYQFTENFYQRQMKLWKTQSTSYNEVDNAKNNRDQAQSSLNAAKDRLQQYINGARPEEIAAAKATLAQQQAALEQAKLNLHDTQLIAPSDGIILTRAVEPGTLLQAGSPVLTLSLTHPVWVRAYIDEVNLSAAVPGEKVHVYSDSIPNKVYIGTIGFVSPTAEFTPKNVETPVLRTDLVYRLRVIIDNADDALRQGMPVTLDLMAHKIEK